MHTPILFPADLHLPHPLQGLAHIAFSLGSVEVSIHQDGVDGISSAGMG